MMGSFQKFLEWRFGVKVSQRELSLDEGCIMTFILSDQQYKNVISQEKMFQTFIFRTQSFIAETMNLPFSLQHVGKIELNGKFLVLSGSNTFISTMLYQLLGYKNLKAEEVFCIPLQNRIIDSGDRPAIDILNSLDCQDDTIQKLNIPSDSLDNIKEQCNQSEYKKRLLVSLGLAFYNLRAYCNGLDKARINGDVIEYDTETESIDEFDMSDMNKKKIQYREYIAACHKFVTDANRYLDELGW